MTATEQRWQAVVAWGRSGLSCKAYAARAGVHPGTLAAWKSKLGQRGAALVVGNALVRVRGAVAAEALSRVLDVLEARA